MKILFFTTLLIQFFSLSACDSKIMRSASKVGGGYGLSDFKTPALSFDGASGTSVVENGTTTITPTLLDDRGYAITNCTASPALPAGLSIAPTTCVISGSSSAVTGPVTYTITATNTYGTGQGELSLNIFSGYLLDKHPNASVAYCLRKLRYNYNGPCLRIIRSSDSQETDIGFVGAAIDTAAITSFVGTSDARIVYWYDQSGNGIALTAFTDALRFYIAVGGVLSYEGADLVLTSNGAIRGFTFASQVGVFPDWSVYTKAKSTSDYSTYVGNRYNVTGIMQHWSGFGLSFYETFYNSMGNYNTHYLKVQATRNDMAATVYGFENGVPSGSAPVTFDFDLGLGSQVFGEFAGGGYEGSVRELVIYPVNHTPAKILEINNLM